MAQHLRPSEAGIGHPKASELWNNGCKTTFLVGRGTAFQEKKFFFFQENKLAVPGVVNSMAGGQSGKDD